MGSGTRAAVSTNDSRCKNERLVLDKEQGNSKTFYQEKSHDKNSFAGAAP
jgi:hypothetical protein